MHPLERLRYVAGIGEADPAVLAREAAEALGEIAASEPAGLVPGCRRLVEHQPSNGPLWWLSARVLSSPDPVHAAREAAAALAADPTARELERALPEESTVLVVGWPDVISAALRRRADLEVLVVDSDGYGEALVRRLEPAGGSVTLVPERGVAAAAAVAGLVLVEATVAGPAGVAAALGSSAAAAVASRAGIEVWAVCATGRVLPAGMWDAAMAMLDGGGLEPWDRQVEPVGADLIDVVVSSQGPGKGAERLADPGCPLAPELLRPAAGGGASPR